VNDWKAAHASAKSYIAALEQHKDMLRDEAVRIAKERDEWKRAYDDLPYGVHEALLEVS
jgi:hypothetical protein